MNIVDVLFGMELVLLPLAYLWWREQREIKAAQERRSAITAKARAHF